MSTTPPPTPAPSQEDRELADKLVRLLSIGGEAYTAGFNAFAKAARPPRTDHIPDPDTERHRAEVEVVLPLIAAHTQAAVAGMREENERLKEAYDASVTGLVNSETALAVINEKVRRMQGDFCQILLSLITFVPRLEAIETICHGTSEEDKEGLECAGIEATAMRKELLDVFKKLSGRAPAESPVVAGMKIPDGKEKPRQLTELIGKIDKALAGEGAS